MDKDDQDEDGFDELNHAPELFLSRRAAYLVSLSADADFGAY